MKQGNTRRSRLLLRIAGIVDAFLLCFLCSTVGQGGSASGPVVLLVLLAGRYGSCRDLWQPTVACFSRWGYSIRGQGSAVTWAVVLRLKCSRSATQSAQV